MGANTPGMPNNAIAPHSISARAPPTNGHRYRLLAGTNATSNFIGSPVNSNEYTIAARCGAYTMCGQVTFSTTQAGSKTITATVSGTHVSAQTVITVTPEGEIFELGRLHVRCSMFLAA